MATESTHPTPLSAAAPAAPKALLRPETLRLMVFIGVPVVLVLLFLVWPYQQWDYSRRESILVGWARWVSSKADWQFCLLVPALVGWLVWLRRDDLHKLPWQGDWAGLLPLGMGLFVYWVGYKADTGYPGFLAVQFIWRASFCWWPDAGGCACCSSPGCFSCSHGRCSPWKTPWHPR
jgi:hypothetical protein